jgi:hypothetical protein
VEYGNYEEVLQDDCIPFTEVRYEVLALLLSERKHYKSVAVK